MMPFEETSTNEAPPIERQQEREREEEQRRLAQSRAQSQQPTAQQRQMQQQQTRHYYESITTSGCGNTPSQAAHNIQTFNLICWPILEKEGGWTCVSVFPQCSSISSRRSHGHHSLLRFSFASVVVSCDYFLSL